MKKHILFYFSIITFLSILIILNGCQKDDGPVQSTFKEKTQINVISDESGNMFQKTSQGDEYVPGEVIVKFVNGATEIQKNAAFNKVKGSVKEKIHTKAMKDKGDNEGLHLIQTTISVPDAVNALKNVSGVEYAEPNYIYTYDLASNDTYYTNGSLWGMYGDQTSPTDQYGCQAGEAWASGNVGSNNVYIGVIDEGIQKTHEDLAANIWVNPFDPVNGKDDDGNGYIDDVNGWDFVYNDNIIYKTGADDHGTHVSGTIGAVGGNGKGVAGVCWHVTIISAKFLGNSGGTTANAVKAIDYMVALKTNHGLNIVALNNSWGGGGFSQSLYDAIGRANSAGILFIAAAGNSSSNNDNTPFYPASYTNTNIISVASITSTGGLSSFSNYGVTSVDLGAPGSNIYSTLPGKKGASSYGSYSGTSMATPHVTGAAALYASSHPGASAATIKSAILGQVIKYSSLSGKCATGGRLNVSGF
jgi:subtilisin family serine protease